MILRIELTENRQSSECYIAFQDGDTPQMIGIQIAAAARIAAKAFADGINMKHKEEAIEAEIMEAFQRDMLEFGGTDDSIRRIDTEETEG